MDRSAELRREVFHHVIRGGRVPMRVNLRTVRRSTVHRSRNAYSRSRGEQLMQPALSDVQRIAPDVAPATSGAEHGVAICARTAVKSPIELELRPVRRSRTQDNDHCRAPAVAGAVKLGPIRSHRRCIRLETPKFRLRGFPANSWFGCEPSVTIVLHGRLQWSSTFTR